MIRRDWVIPIGEHLAHDAFGHRSESVQQRPKATPLLLFCCCAATSSCPCADAPVLLTSTSHSPTPVGNPSQVYFGKTREVVANLRASDGVMAVDRRQSMQTSIMGEMLKRQSLGATAGGIPGLGAGFDPKAALAGLRSTKKPPPP